MAATEHIKPNSVFLAVPNKLLITVDKAKQSELKDIYKENDEEFSKNFFNKF